MSDEQYFPATVNRAALAISRKQAFVDWLHTTPDSEKITLDVVNSETSFYLVAEATADPDPAKAVDVYYEDIFEQELLAWYTDSDYWPEEFTLDLFHSFFEVRAGSMVIDLGDDYLEVED